MARPPCDSTYGHHALAPSRLAPGVPNPSPRDGCSRVASRSTRRHPIVVDISAPRLRKRLLPKKQATRASVRLRTAITGIDHILSHRCASTVSRFYFGTNPAEAAMNSLLCSQRCRQFLTLPRYFQICGADVRAACPTLRISADREPGIRPHRQWPDRGQPLPNCA